MVTTNRIPQVGSRPTVGKSIEPDEVERRQRSSGELDEAGTDGERPEIDAEEAQPVDQDAHFGLGGRVAARMKQHPPAAVRARIAGNQVW